VLVVLGHEKCGAVAAAASGEKMPTANLDAIVSKIFPVVERFKGCAQGDQLIGLSVEGNVQQSARDIVENSPILQQDYWSENSPSSLRCTGLEPARFIG
jgi:carbonic anhydrase